MARRRSEPNPAKSAGIAFVVLTVCYCLPTFAATPAATIEETAAAMARNDIAPASLLAPQAEAAIKNAFSETTVRDTTAFVLERRRAGMSEIASAPITISIAENEAETDSDESADEKDEVESGINTRLPGVSSEEMLRYRKVMFRRDI